MPSPKVFPSKNDIRWVASGLLGGPLALERKPFFFRYGDLKIAIPAHA